MSRKSTHLSRLYAPKSWRINRKETKWITNTVPGTHKKDLSIPLVVALRDNINLISTRRELNYLINNKLIKLNNRFVKTSKVAAGLFDVISLPSVKKYFRVMLDIKGKFNLVEISEKDSSFILLKVIRKTAIRGNKILVTLSNGYNLVYDKKISVNDSVIFDLTTNKIKSILSFSKGDLVYFIRGKRAGKVAKFEEKQSLGIFKRTYIAKLKMDKESIESDMKNLIAIGNGKEVNLA